MGRRRGRPRAPSETTPGYVSALGTLAPDHRDDLVKVGAALDAAMFGHRTLDPIAAGEIDDLVAAIESDWTNARNPGDLVPTS